MPEMAHVVAIDTRYVGEAALAAGDREVLALTVKFLNTYLRAALNARDVRTAYNVLNQYRQLAECVAGDGATPGRRRRWSTSPSLQVLRAARARHGARLRHRDGGLRSVRAVRDGQRARAPPATIACWRSSWRSTRSRRRGRGARAARRAQGAGQAGVVLPVRGATARARRSTTTWRDESPERLRSIRDEMLAIDVQGLLGGRRPRHQLRLPRPTRAKRSCASSSRSSPRSPPPPPSSRT